ncbi:recombinase family protein [Saccharopolyspora sp. NPDC002376]
MAQTARTRKLRTTPDAVLRALIYVRQSTHREESISLEMQETSCREHCARHGYHVVEVIPDPGISGRKWDKRPGVQKVLAMASEGGVDRVIVWRWSRLARRGLYQHLAIDTIERTGAIVESSTEPFDTKTAGGQFGRDVMFAAATFDSNQKGEQWREAHDRRRRLGLPATGGPRFGYIRHHGDGIVEHYAADPETSEALRWMYEAYIAGWGFRAIARELNARGIPNTRGGRHSEEGVRGILDSGFAAGLIVRDEYRSDKQVSIPITERVWDQGAQELGIGPEMWEQYLEKRRVRTHMAPGTINPKHVLSGLVRCGDEECGRGPMNRRRIGKHYTLTCVNHLKYGVGQPCNVMENRVLEHVFDYLALLADDVGEAAEQARAVQRAQLQVRSDAETARRELAAIDKQLADLTLQLVRERIPESAYDIARDDLLAERDEAASRVALAEKAAQQSTAGEELPAVARGLLGEWKTLPVLDRRELLAKLIARAEIIPGEENSAGRGRRRAAIRIVPAWEDTALSLCV